MDAIMAETNELEDFCDIDLFQKIKMIEIPDRIILVQNLSIWLIFFKLCYKITLFDLLKKYNFLINISGLQSLKISNVDNIQHQRSIPHISVRFNWYKKFNIICSLDSFW
jgi:hypothetical protein